MAAIKKCKTRLLLAVIDALVDRKSEFFDDSEHLKQTRLTVALTCRPCRPKQRSISPAVTVVQGQEVTTRGAGSGQSVPCVSLLEGRRYSELVLAWCWLKLR